jgi:uncharacterized protein YciI
MKALILILVCMGCIITTKAQTNVTYDSVLAKKLGGNANGMKNYVMVILTSGTADIKDKQLTDSLFTGHMNNIGNMAKAGKLAVAGPFGKNDLGYRGIFILNTSDIEEARAIVAKDPAVNSGLLGAVYLKWFGSAALMETPDIHNRITKPAHQ